MSSDTAHLPPSGIPNDKPPLAPLPRLRIHHIMLWTAVTAGWLALARIVFDTLPGQQSMVQLNLLAAAVVYGAATSVAGLGVFWRTRGLAFFTQPGHWLACWIVLGIHWSITTNLLLYWQLQATANGNVWERAEESWLLWLLLNPWINFSVAVPCLLLLAYWAADTLAWRVFFVGWAICRCVPLLLRTFSSGQRLASAGLLQEFMLIPAHAPLVLLAVAGLNDYWNRRLLHRHWSHWAGVLVSIATMSLELLMFVWLWLAPPQP